MSYSFQQYQRYRMPTHFGPSLGPRQGLEGRQFSNLDSPHDTLIQAVFEAKPSELDTFLPPGFHLCETSNITLTFCYSTGVEWLAGRGYNTFGVSIPAVYQGQKDIVRGNFLLILWENMADPIITGREDLGFSKMYCEIPEPQFIGSDVICRASWDGCQFASLELSDLQKISPDALPSSSPSDGSLHYKYIPKTGVPGEADIEYPVLTPSENPNLNIVESRLAKTAVGHFRSSTWEELPTLVHIVNALSTLTLGNCLEATLLKTQGGKDLSDQRRLT